MPDTSKLEKLNRELEKSEKKLRKAINDEKALQHQLKVTDNTIKDSISDIIEGDKPGDDNPGSPDAPNNTYPIPQP